MQAAASSQAPSEQHAVQRRYDLLVAAIDNFLSPARSPHTTIEWAQQAATLRSRAEQIALSVGDPFVKRCELDKSKLTLTSLPVELITQIIDYLDQSALHALSITCRYTYEMARKALYKRPVVGDLLKGDSFRFACMKYQADRLDLLTSLVCTRWHQWQPWFEKAGGLPNILHVELSDTTDDCGISLFRTLQHLARHPRLQVATLLRPLDDLGVQKSTKAEIELSALTSLNLLKVEAKADTFCFGLASLCPNIIAIRLTLSRDVRPPRYETYDEYDSEYSIDFSDDLPQYATFRASDFDFLVDFAKLQILEVDGPLQSDARSKLSDVTTRLRTVSFDLMEPCYDVYFCSPPCPANLFEGAHDHLESLYWAGVRWPIASRIIDTIHNFPSLTRLKLIHPANDALGSDGGDSDCSEWGCNFGTFRSRQRYAAELEPHGFSVQHCSRCIYAARAPSGGKLDTNDRRGYTKSRARCDEVSCACVPKKKRS